MIDNKKSTGRCMNKGTSDLWPGKDRIRQVVPIIPKNPSNASLDGITVRTESILTSSSWPNSSRLSVNIATKRTRTKKRLRFVAAGPICRSLTYRCTLRDRSSESLGRHHHGSKCCHLVTQGGKIGVVIMRSTCGGQCRGTKRFKWR